MSFMQNVISGDLVWKDYSEETKFLLNLNFLLTCFILCCKYFKSNNLKNKDTN